MEVLNLVRCQIQAAPGISLDSKGVIREVQGRGHRNLAAPKVERVWSLFLTGTAVVILGFSGLALVWVNAYC